MIAPAIWLLAGAMAIAGTVLLARWSEAIAWQRSLVAYHMVLPRGLAVTDVMAWLGGIAASTHAARGALVAQPPVAIDLTADEHGIHHYLLVPDKMRDAALAGLRAALPGVRLEEQSGYRSRQPAFRMAAEAALTSTYRPLASERAEATSRHLLASLQPLGRGEQVVVQWILTSAGTPRPVQQPPSGADGAALPWWLEARAPSDADDVRAQRLKHREPLLHASLRVGVVAGSKADGYRLFGRTWGSLRGQNAAGALVVRRWWVFQRWASSRLAHRTVPLTRWPLLINARELTGLLGFPLGDIHLPGLPRAAARQLPPAVTMPARGTTVGHSNYPGLGDRPLALAVTDRLRHTWAIGPTGVGKSTLLCNLITQDIAAGRGVAVLDPKGDLIADVLDRVPEHRRDDVIVIDPSQTDRPVGLNVLHAGRGEHARELAVDHLVSVMANLWHSSFGPRTSDVMRNTVLTLTHTRAADGSANTFTEIPEVLLQPRFRAFLLAQSTVPESVRQFWQTYDQLSDNAREQIIAPSLNKLRSFTTRTAIRLMLGQSDGIRLDSVFTERRILLVSLAKGTLGTDTAALVGSLVMAGLWQATLQRISVPAERRHPVILYLDEFQDFLRLPLDLTDMLAQARGLGVGLVLAHQFLDQLNDSIRSAALGTVRTQIAFQVEHDDATVLAKRFSPLSAEDLSGQAVYEIAMRPCVAGSTQSPVTGITLPLSAATTDGVALASASRERFGLARNEVEAAMRRRLEPDGQHGRRLGREVRGDNA